MSGVIDLSKLIDVPVVNRRRAVGLTPQAIEKKFKPRLRKDGIETAIANLEQSIEDANGRWENLTVMEVYKKAPCWTIKSNRVKFTDGSKTNQVGGVLNVCNENETLQNRLKKESVDVSIRIGAKQLEMDWNGDGKATKSLNLDGYQVAPFLTKILGLVKDGVFDDALHELNKESRHCKPPKKYNSKFDRYLTDEDLEILETYTKDNNLNPEEV